MHFTRPSLSRPARVLLDLATIIVSFWLTYFVRAGLMRLVPFGEEILFGQYWELVGPVGLVWLSLLHWLGAYAWAPGEELGQEAARIAKANALGVLIVLAYAFLFRILIVPRSLILLWAPVTCGMLILERWGVRALLRWARKAGRHREGILVVGAGREAEDFCARCRNHPEWGMEVLGLLTPRPGVAELYGVPVLGTYGDLPRVLTAKPVDGVTLALPAEETARAAEILGACEEQGIPTLMISGLLQGILPRARLMAIQGMPLLSFRSVPQKEWQLFLKRCIDILGSALGLILLLPLLALTALAVKLTSPGPIFYRWRVVGLNRREFVSYKFRTMAVDADERKPALSAKNEMRGPVFKLREDPRVTPLGRFLRKFSVDELPQLYSVLKGDMSLVGPRPPLATEVQGYEGWHRRKLSIKPGITCLWQVNGRSLIRDFNEWVRLDLDYIDNWSLWLDIKILVRTIPVVLRGTGL
ncbi:MAG: sugar transferase [Candidatus Rokubacteria bacterium]|nr:sugar transferase [Candidatus Rokubacteria bacterium]